MKEHFNLDLNNNYYNNKSAKPQYNLNDLSQLIKNTLQEFDSLKELQKAEQQMDNKLQIQDPKYVFFL